MNDPSEIISYFNNLKNDPIKLDSKNINNLINFNNLKNDSTNLPPKWLVKQHFNNMLGAFFYQKNIKKNKLLFSFFSFLNKNFPFRKVIETPLFMIDSCEAVFYFFYNLYQNCRNFWLKSFPFTSETPRAIVISWYLIFLDETLESTSKKLSNLLNTDKLTRERIRQIKLKEIDCIFDFLRNILMIDKSISDFWFPVVKEDEHFFNFLKSLFSPIAKLTHRNKFIFVSFSKDKKDFFSNFKFITVEEFIKEDQWNQFCFLTKGCKTAGNFLITDKWSITSWIKYLPVWCPIIDLKNINSLNRLRNFWAICGLKRDDFDSYFIKPANVFIKRPRIYSMFNEDRVNNINYYLSIDYNKFISDSVIGNKEILIEQIDDYFEKLKASDVKIVTRSHLEDLINHLDFILIKYKNDEQYSCPWNTRALYFFIKNEFRYRFHFKPKSGYNIFFTGEGLDNELLSNTLKEYLITRKKLFVPISELIDDLKISRNTLINSSYQSLLGYGNSTLNMGLNVVYLKKFIPPNIDVFIEEVLGIVQKSPYQTVLIDDLNSLIFNYLLKEFNEFLVSPSRLIKNNIARSFLKEFIPTLHVKKFIVSLDKNINSIQDFLDLIFLESEIIDLSKVLRKINSLVPNLNLNTIYTYFNQIITSRKMLFKAPQILIKVPNNEWLKKKIDFVLSKMAYVDNIIYLNYSASDYIGNFNICEFLNCLTLCPQYRVIFKEMMPLIRLSENLSDHYRFEVIVIKSEFYQELKLEEDEESLSFNFLKQRYSLYNKSFFIN